MRATEIWSRVRRAIADLKRGKMVILTDDEDRENEGDLVMAAEKVTPRAINFMARHGRGLICLALTEEKVRALALPLMVSDNTSAFQTAFTVSIEAARGVTTGISAADRATTIRAAIAPDARPADLARPGHIFPLRARAGGVLVRPGQTEGSVDLARLAGLQPAGVICEILNEDGTMARRPHLLRFARRHRLTLLSVADLIAYRLTHERLVERLGEVEAPGGMRAVAYRSLVDPASVHLALTVGDLSGSEPMLTRIHRSTSLGDTLEQATGKGPLRAAYERIMSEGRGVLVRLAHTARGEPLALAPPSNEQRIPGHPGESRLREFGIGSQILKDLGLKRIRLLTRLPNRIVGVERYGIEVVEQIFLGAPRSEETPPPKGQVVPLRATRLARR